MKKVFLIALLALGLAMPVAIQAAPANDGVPMMLASNPNLAVRTWYQGSNMHTVVYNTVTGEVVYMSVVDSNGNLIWGWTPN